jgi:uncharacterized membrane protein
MIYNKSLSSHTQKNMNIPFLKKRFFQKDEEEAIIQAIKEAELNTSGEIKVHIEAKSNGDVFGRALEVFKELNMHQTEQRNGVLIYLATTDRTFAIVADEGINRVVPENFWENIKDKMTADFKQGAFVIGLQTGIQMTGEQLKSHFPYQSGDKNELSDELSLGSE